MSYVLIDSQIARMVGKLLSWQAGAAKQGRKIGTDVGLANAFNDLLRNATSIDPTAPMPDENAIKAKGIRAVADYLESVHDMNKLGEPFAFAISRFREKADLIEAGDWRSK
jgi:hypothetical protein